MDTIMKLDHFVNTIEKRHYLFILIVLSMALKMFWSYGALATRLLALSTYDDVLALLDTNILSSTYIARVVERLITSYDIGIIDILSALLNAIRIEGICILIGVSLYINTIRKAYPKICGWVSLITFVLVLICIFFLYQGFHASTLLDVVYALQKIGIVILSLCVAYSLLCIYAYLHFGMCYKKVYPIEVIELQD